MADDFEPAAPPVSRPFLEFRPLVGALRVASDPRKLILATSGLLILEAGWSGISRVFADPVPRSFSVRFNPLDAIQADVLSRSFGQIIGLLLEPFRAVVLPFANLFTIGSGASAWFESALMALWGAVVWGIIGGAMARIAVVQASTDRKVGLATAVRFALKKAPSLIGAPLTPMLAVAVLTAGCALFGLMSRIPWGIGPGIATILGFVPLVLGLLMTLILLGLAAGWPLMHATVAAENEDAPDALSRSYSYVNQRLGRYAAHVVVSLILGAIGLVLASVFAASVIRFSTWGVSLGAGRPQPSDSFWEMVVGLVVHAWVYSYFWSASTVIYLILRRDVDGTAWHDVYLPEQVADTFAGEPGPETSKPVVVEV